MDIIMPIFFLGVLLFLVVGSIAGIRAKFSIKALQQQIGNLENRIKILQRLVEEFKQPAQRPAQPEATPPVQSPMAVSTPPVTPEKLEPIQAPEYISEKQVQEPAMPADELSISRKETEKPLLETLSATVQPVTPQAFNIQATPKSPETIPPEISAPSEAPMEKSAEPEMDLETRIGAVWFNRIGLVGLIIGFALLGRMIHFEPWHKVAASYLTSALLLAIGWWYEERLQRFAHPVAAGGLALAFFTSFAAHFLKPMSCMGLGASLTLMGLSVGAILLCTERWKSQSMAVMAIFLGHVAAYVAGGSADSFSLAAILFLCLTSVLLFLRHNWIPLNLFSVSIAYFTHVLWALRDHAPSTPEASFWVNFLFLSSYYFIFLYADLICHHRFLKWGRDSFTPAQRSAGRSLGPVSLILYATIVTALFYTTRIYWSNIFIYFILLAGLQIGLLFYHQSRRNPDYPFYAATAIVFITLGLFSWLQGLSLNLSLAAEALILLILSRGLQFWYLNPLAQVVLIINFLHFWLSGASHFMTWPTYLGCSMTALVYFVKSRLEETWRYASSSETSEDESPWVAKLRVFYGNTMTPFSYLHAIGGAILVVYQSVHFFAPPWEESSIALFALAVTIGVIILNSRSLIPAAWFMQTVLTLLWVIRVDQDSFLPVWAAENLFYGWIIAQSLLVSVIACAWMALHFAQKRNRPSLIVSGIVTLILAIPMLFDNIRPMNPRELYVPVWLIAPLAYWYLSILLVQMKKINEWQWDRYLWGFIEQKLIGSIGKIAVFFVLMGAVLTNQVFITMIASPTLPFVLLSLIALMILFLSLFYDLSILLPGLGLHAFLYINGYLAAFVKGDLLETGIGTCWLCASVVIIAGILIYAQTWKQKVVFAICSLAMISIAIEAIWILLSNIETRFSPYPIWAGIIVFLWVYEEILRSLFLYERRKAVEWEITPALLWMKQNTYALCHILSLIAAFLLFMITGHKGIDEHTLWLSMAYMILLVISAFLRRSSALASGVPLLLLFAHILYYHKMNPGVGANDFPYMTMSLVVLTVAFSGLLERVIFRSKQPVSQGLRWIGLTGIVLFQGLGFLLYGVFSWIRETTLIGETSLIFPLQQTFPLAVFLIGWLSRQGLLQLAPYCFLLIWLVPHMIFASITIPLYQADLLAAGGLVFIQWIVMERILTLQKNRPVTFLGEETLEHMRKLLVVAASGLMLYVITNADWLRGYWTTLGWSLLAFLVIALGFIWKDKTYRRTALAIFFLSILRIVFVDVAQLEAFYRMIAFLCLGACLIAVSFLYSRFARDIHRWL